MCHFKKLDDNLKEKKNPSDTVTLPWYHHITFVWKDSTNSVHAIILDLDLTYIQIY